MKQLRAKGIDKLIEDVDEELLHLARLSRNDEILQLAFHSARDALVPAETRIAEIIDNHRERDR